MTNLLYLAIPAVLLILVGAIISLRERRPSAITEDVDSFARSMKALSSSRSARPGTNSRSSDAG
ncbi:MAG: hypothetical protein M1288_04985 [Actinobacteria bacterium]|jgi:hypothetical protein|nr:hypothetical protein [Actinomycetota bacterium]